MAFSVAPVEFDPRADTDEVRMDEVRASGRVLVVGGEAEAAQGVAEILDRNGFTTFPVAGPLGFAAVHLFEPDIVVLWPGAASDALAWRVLKLPDDIRPRVLLLAGTPDADELLCWVRTAGHGG